MENQTNNQTDENGKTQQPKVYSYRWFIAILAAIVFVIIRVIMNSFGIVNNVYVAYFNLTYIEVDWITLMQLPGDILCSLVLAFVIFVNRTGFRTQLLVMTGCEVVTCVCLICAYLYRVLYPLIYVSQFVIGIGNAMTITASTIFAINWFPKHQIGTALSIRSASVSLGSAFGYFIPSHLFLSPCNNRTNASVVLNPEVEQSWIDESRKRFLMFAVPLLIVCFVLFVVEFLCVFEHPPEPPNAQSSINEERNKPSYKNIFSTDVLKKFLVEVWNILKNPTGFLIGVIILIRTGIVYALILFLSEIMRGMFAGIYSGFHSNKLAGYVLILTELAYTVGSFASGLIYDKYRKASLQINGSSAVSFIAVIGFLLGYYFKSFIMLLCFGGLFGFMLGLSISVCYAVLIQRLDNHKQALVMDLAKMEIYFGILIIGEISRFLLNFVGSIAVFSFFILLWLLVMVLSCCVKFDESNNDETTPLLETKSPE